MAVFIDSNIWAAYCIPEKFELRVQTGNWRFGPLEGGGVDEDPSLETV